MANTKVAAGSSRSPNRKVGASLVRELLHLLVELGPSRVPGLPPECRSGAPPASKVLALYRHLLRHFLSLKANMGVVTELEDDVLAEFMGSNDKEPLKFIGYRQGDLARIAMVLDVDIIISSAAGAKIVDTRLWTAMCGHERSPVFFRWNKRRGLSAVLGVEPPHPLVSEGHVMSPKVVHVGPGDDQVRAILSLLADPAEIPGDLAPCHDLHNLVGGLLDAEDAISRITGGGCLVLAAHLGLTNLTTPTPVKDSMQNFQLLGCFPRPKASDSRSKMVAVVAAYPNTFYLPRPELREKILAGTRFQRTEDPKLDQLVRHPNSARPAQPRGPCQVRTPPGSACPCALCADGKTYDANFSKGGQSQLPYRSEPHTLEYLRMFNLDTEDNIALVKTAFDLSVASMDCESITIDMPRGASDELVPVAPVAHLRHDGSVRKVQRVALFGHGDFLDEEIRFFEADEARPLGAVVDDYVEHLLARRDEAERVKTALLKPLYDFVNVLKEAHESYCREEGAVGSGGYWKTLPGRFHRSLDRLCASYTVQGYNGARYDFPALATSLAVSAKAKGAPLRLHKKGSAVTSIELRQRGKGITFRDPMLLLDSSCSLAKLAAMCGHELKKVPVPFGQLDSFAALRRESFSWRPEDWKDELSGKDVGDPADIAQAKAEFERLGCESIGDYLRHYLRTDVLLLRDCTRSLYRMFADMLDCHPVDTNRYTIASLSYYSCQMRLFRDRRMGVYRPRVSPLYSVLKSACRGGLVQVTRNVALCGDEEDGPITGINSHLHGSTPDQLLPPVKDEADYPTPPPAVKAVLDAARTKPHKIALGRKGSTCPGDHLSARHIVNAAGEAADELGPLDDARVVLDSLSELAPETGTVVRALDVASLYSSACKYQSVRGPPRGGPRGGCCDWPLGATLRPAPGAGRPTEIWLMIETR